MQGKFAAVRRDIYFAFNGLPNMLADHSLSHCHFLPDFQLSGLFFSRVCFLFRQSFLQQLFRGVPSLLQ